MGCLIKTVILLLAIFGLCVGLYMGRVPHKIVGGTICHVMKNKQNLDANIGRVEFNELGKMSLYDFKVKSRQGDKDMIDIPRVDVGLSLRNVRNGMSAADRIHIEGGTIRADLVGKLFRQRRNERRNRGGGSGGSGGSDGSGDGEIKPTPNRGKRHISFNNLTLQGATREMNLIIVKRKVTLKIKDIEGEMTAEGPKVHIKRLKWQLLGAVKPEVNDIEMNMDEIRNGRAIKHLPREIRGLILTIWILMGGKPDAALQAK